MNRRQALRLVRAVSGEDDAEFVDVLPPVARYHDQVLIPSRGLEPPMTEVVAPMISKPETHRGVTP